MQYFQHGPAPDGCRAPTRSFLGSGALSLATLLVLAGGCVGPAFRVPTLSRLPALERNPSVPLGQSETGAVPNGVTEVQATRGPLFRRDAVLAVGPITLGERDLSLPLLQRLLARRGARVMDLSQSGSLQALASTSRADPTTTLRGPWSALTWAARWGDASMLLVNDPVTVTHVPDPRRARVRYDPTELASYTNEREARVAECQQRLPRIEAEERRIEREYQTARREHEATRTWIDRLGRDTEAERAQQAVETALATLTAQRSTCEAALRSLPSAEVLTGRAADHNARDARTMAQASGTFRVIAMPGGELLWTASLVRRGDNDEQALGMLLDAVVDTLHGDRRTPTVGDEPSAASSAAPPPARPRTRRGRTRRP